MWSLLANCQTLHQDIHRFYETERDKSADLHFKAERDYCRVCKCTIFIYKALIVGAEQFYRYRDIYRYVVS